MMQVMPSSYVGRACHPWQHLPFPSPLIPARTMTFFFQRKNQGDENMSTEWAGGGSADKKRSAHQVVLETESRLDEGVQLLVWSVNPPGIAWQLEDWGEQGWPGVVNSLVGYLWK